LPEIGVTLAARGVSAMSEAPAPTAWDWTPPTRRQCLRCGTWFLTRELNPRCPTCGLKETPE
jgi:hypothetical protein